MCNFLQREMKVTEETLSCPLFPYYSLFPLFSLSICKIHLTYQIYKFHRHNEYSTYNVTNIFIDTYFFLFSRMIGVSMKSCWAAIPTIETAGFQYYRLMCPLCCSYVNLFRLDSGANRSRAICPRNRSNIRTFAKREKKEGSWFVVGGTRHGSG